MQSNFIKEFKDALTLQEYSLMLGDQADLYRHHYQRAQSIQSDLDLPTLKILVITEPWCGDSTAILPVIQKFFVDRKAELRITLRDKNPELMNQFLTRGGRAIPIILVLDEQGNFLMRFGPRPKKAQDIFETHRAAIEQGQIDRKEVGRKIRSFYAQDRGQAIIQEFVNGLENVIKSEAE